MNLNKGIWFYGLSGSGKSYASKCVSKKIKNSFLIDGDQVRQHVSFDLDYDLNSRKIQIKRILGIAKLVINNDFFPIASSVYLNEEVLDLCNINGIKVINIQRSTTEILAVREIYKNTNNVVGKDIPMPKLNARSIFNDGTKKFKDDILKILDN